MRNWFGCWPIRCPTLTDEQRLRRDRWRAQPMEPSNALLHGSRCVVVDVETSGLNLWQDQLISVGAVAVVNGKIDLGDSFYVVLRQASVSAKENILVHGIGGSAQAAGMLPAEALLAFLEYLGKSPLVAFHVVFDETMIRRAMRTHLGFAFRHFWLDMAYIMPALHPAGRSHSLDDWIARFGIVNDARHNALADAQVTAQLFQVALHIAGQKNITDFAGLRDLEKAQRWVSRVA